MTTVGVDSRAGLTGGEARRRLAEYGPNELEDRGRKRPWQILAAQFTALLVVVLMAAAALSLLIGDLKNAIAILAIVVLNALFGFVQEYRAERAMASLKQMAAPAVRVRRDDNVTIVPAREVVPGDVVLLEAGNIVPADARVVVSASLRVQEAALTGESEAVEKNPAAIVAPDAPLGDRHDMVYMGTVVAYGRGEAVVVSTAMHTELGRIASLMQAAAGEPTPLQRRLAGLGRQLAVLALAIVAVIAAIGLSRGEPIRTVFLTAVSMAVAAVPEGLMAVVTIALALGARRMLKRRALIRQLAAVEALGSVTVICSDKTGTLTQNRMTVTCVDVAGREPVDPFSEQATLEAALALLAGALCNDASLATAGDGSVSIVGDPTEAAFVAAALRVGVDKTSVDATLPRLAEIPFDSDRKRMTTVHRLTERARTHLARVVGSDASMWLTERAAGVVATKGAVDRLLEVCSGVWDDGRCVTLDATWRMRILAATDRAASRGMRVLGVAMRPWDGGTPGSVERLESDLTFVGLVGMIDPPRAEAKDAIGRCRDAGIRPIMITGDHPLTAAAIARELGIESAAGVISGVDLATLDGQSLDALVERASVYARVAPEHKLRIVEALQRRGHIVAMTGDGVNDAPALKQADVGVAMGITGTDVSKDAADMVLLDDNFATIVAAVEEGRVIYDNIRKFITFLVSSNSAELWVMLLAPALGLPMALLPLQILWINLVTDGPAALALGVEPAETDVMRRPPRRPDEPILTRALAWRILSIGALMAIVSLGEAVWYWRAGNPAWQTMVFTTLALSQMAYVMAARSAVEPLWRIGLLSNPALLAAVVGTVALQLAVIYTPALQTIFGTVSLSARELAVALGWSLVVYAGGEVSKRWPARNRGLLEARS